MYVEEQNMNSTVYLKIKTHRTFLKKHMTDYFRVGLQIDVTTEQLYFRNV